VGGRGFVSDVLAVLNRRGLFRIRPEFFLAAIYILSDSLATPPLQVEPFRDQIR